MIQGMNHFTITAENREATLDFYVNLLGFAQVHRPELGHPGAWLSAAVDGPAILHIYWDRPMPSPRTGVIDHMAFTASNLKAIKKRFDDRGLAYDLRKQKGSGTWQLFSHDPNGAKVELDFDAGESLE
jgi:catechol 2,3-dioxygenase-like lactoylglutathione lyase family enzyme